MSTVEAKRKGRPPKARDEAAIENDAPEVAEDSIETFLKPTTPLCPRCRKPTERSTKLLRAYDMAVLRCVGCHEVAIEGDEPTNRYDIETAKSGRPPLLAARAAVLFASKRVSEPLPSFDAHGFDAAVTSEWDDPRWTTLND
jgi:hypothetical protein